MKNNKKQSRQEKSMKTKKKIFECANQLFEEYGFEHVSVDQIVERAEVSKGTFYVHFESKDELVTALLSDYVKKLDFDYRSFFQQVPAGTSVSDTLLFVIEKIADVLTNIIGYDKMKVAYKAQLTKKICPVPIMGYDREIYSIFEDIISRGVEQGEFTAEFSVETISKHCIMSLRGITYEWCVRYPQFDLKEEYVIHFKLMLKGLKM